MSIPTIKGRYKIGTSTWKIAIPKRVFGTAKLKVTKDPAFQLEEVAFQIFYPTEDQPKNVQFGVPWLDKPLKQWSNGYGVFLGISQWLLYPVVLILSSLLKIPAYRGAPLKTSDEGKWPLIFFSHGLAGTRTTYSQLCGKLAADGNVVIALEHRDGTAPSTLFPVDGKTVPRHYARVEELEWPEKLDTPTTPLPLRTQQLEIRFIEILESFKAFKRLVGGDSDAFSNKQDYSYWGSWTGQIETDSIVFTGHSFGGCTALYILTHPTPPSYDRLPISKAIFYDPWMEPFPPEFEDTVIKDNTAFSIPILTINSEEFTLWKEHQAHQERVLDPWIKQAGYDSAFLTLVRSRHMAFSDFPVFSPFRKVPMAMHEDMYQMSRSFLKGDLQSFLSSIDDRIVKDYQVDNPDDNKRKRIRADAGQVVVHMSSPIVPHSHL